MGYAMVFSACFGCGRVFGFNPHKVPSIPVKGVKQPICRDCVERVNPMRKANGVPEIVPDPNAYEPIEEHEL